MSLFFTYRLHLPCMGPTEPRKRARRLLLNTNTRLCSSFSGQLLSTPDPDPEQPQRKLFATFQRTRRRFTPPADGRSISGDTYPSSDGTNDPH
uniref:Uncharacterized protein n=1 Tax=Mycena chlorophos TaxID=658473 RepID=A0ABQ0KWL2_MYCCL|nr:predicted protein [Mycena chlorophos]